MAIAQISYWANFKVHREKCERTKIFSLKGVKESERVLTQGGLEPHVAEVSSWQTN